MNAETITLTRPDDWHLHLRDGTVLADTVAHSARMFARAIVMPNLAPPVSSVAAASAYRDRILAHVPAGRDFEPLMTLYLTDALAAAEVRAAFEQGLVHAVKYYPAGATTNSENGITSIEKTYPVLEALIDLKAPVLFHGEVTDPGIDIFDREAVFIESVLDPLLDRYPELKVVMEHITTATAVDYVRQHASDLAATITAHHLLYDRNHMLVGGVRPHFYCLPVLKRKSHRQALVNAATSGESRFFLGTDSAPHVRQAKESDCGCAGIFTAHAAIELYAEVFEAAGALDRLEGFASHHGADFYGLPRNETSLTLRRTEWRVPQQYPLGDSVVVPLRAGESISWQIEGSTS